MARTHIKKAGFILTFILLLSAHSLPAQDDAPPSESADEEPAVFIHYRGIYGHFVANSHVGDILALDDGPGEYRWGCLIKPPDSLNFYKAAYPILSGAAEGFCEFRDIRIKIVNKTSGEDIYLDRFGGVYFYGENITRKMTEEEFFAVRNMLPLIDEHCRLE